jgi:hypothetical protein
MPVNRMVMPRNMGAWGFAAESGTTFAGEITATTIMGLSGGGYEAGARLEVEDTASGGFFGAPLYPGLAFSTLLTMFYTTLKEVGDTAPMPTLQFNIAADVTDAQHNQTWQGRMVYEPYLTEAATPAGVWTRWNVMHGAGWWFTKAPLSTFAGPDSPKSMAQILAAYPHMGINANPALALCCFKAGSGWNKFIGYVAEWCLAAPQWPTVVERWWFAPTTDFGNYYGYIDT